MIEYIITKNGQRFCYELPLGTPYEIVGDEDFIEVSAITL